MASPLLPCTKEMVIADFEQIRRRGIGRDVAAEVRVGAIRAYHHGKRIPTYQRGDARFNFRITGELRLIGERNRVCIRRVQDRRHRHAHHACVIEQLPQDESCALGAFVLDDGVEGIQPFLGLDGIEVLGEYAPQAGNADVGKIGHWFQLLAIRRGLERPAYRFITGKMLRRFEKHMVSFLPHKPSEKGTMTRPKAMERQ